MKITKRGQLSIEFLSLVAMGVFMSLVIIIALVSLSADKTKEKTYYELNDLGRVLQEEILFAIDLEDGYMRSFEIPTKVNDLSYNITIGNTSMQNGYLQIFFENQEIYYPIPAVRGILTKGINQLEKINNTIYLNR